MPLHLSSMDDAYTRAHVCAHIMDVDGYTYVHTYVREYNSKGKVSLVLSYSIDETFADGC